MNNVVADILDKAADLIEPEGAWVQGAMEITRDGKPCYCALGAIAATADKMGGSDNAHKAASAVRELLDGQTVVFWNDSLVRTQDEVVAKLREAAAIARREFL